MTRVLLQNGLVHRHQIGDGYFIYPIGHTRSLLELSVLFRQSFRLRHALWMDMVKAKKTALHVSCQPDLLLCHSLTEHRADFYLFLAATEELFQNLGRLIRKLLSGDVKEHNHTVFFNPGAQSALNRNILFGLWTPSFRMAGPAAPFKSLDLFRYDHDIFDKQIWIPEPVKPGTESTLPRTAHWETVQYAGRHFGKRNWLLSEIIDPYDTAFQHALEDAMA